MFNFLGPNLYIFGRRG